MKRSKTWMVVLSGFTLATAACLCTSALPFVGQESEANSVDAVDSGAVETAEEESGPVIELPEIGGPSLPVSHSDEVGGYSMNMPEGWVAQSFFGITLAAPTQDGVEIQGFEDIELNRPVILAFFGGEEEGPDLENASVDELRDEVLADFAGGGEDGVTVSEPRDITVGSVPAIAVDFSGTDPELGQDIAGRVVVVVVSPEQSGMFMGMAPQADWSEFDATFDAIIDSVEFFTPNPDADLEGIEGLVDGDTPTSTNSLQFGSTLTGTMEDGGVHDWTFGGSAGDTVTITLTPTTDDFDPTLAIIGPDGSLLQDIDDGFSGEPESITFSLPGDGQYTARVTPFAFGGGPYSIILFLN